jgi:hypothetical protein
LSEAVDKERLVSLIHDRLEELNKGFSGLAGNLSQAAKDLEADINRAEDRTLQRPASYVEQLEETVESHGVERTRQLPSAQTLCRNFLDEGGVKHPVEELVPNQPLSDLWQKLKERIDKFGTRTVAEVTKPEGRRHSAPLTADSLTMLSDWIDRATPLLPPEVVRGIHHGQEDAIFGSPEQLSVLRNMLSENERKNLIPSPLSNQLTVVTALSLNQHGLGRDRSQQEDGRN